MQHDFTRTRTLTWRLMAALALLAAGFLRLVARPLPVAAVLLAAIRRLRSAYLPGRLYQG